MDLTREMAERGIAEDKHDWRRPGWQNTAIAKA